jgi:methylated-DNA-[protein]-cysteine S-methyltransferase
MLSSLAIDTPIGRITVAATEDAITAVAWMDGSNSEPSALLCEAARQLRAYFERRLTDFDLPLMPAGSPFERRLWGVMQRIPYGQTRCYGELAIEVGSAPRAVGRACGRNPIPIIIPCHRVLSRNGLGGYSGGTGLTTKRILLGLERAVPNGRAADSASVRRTTGVVVPSRI